MQRVLKFKHIKMFGRDFDAILVADCSIPWDMSPCELCIYKDTPSSDCYLINECTTPTDAWNTYWLLGACTAYPYGDPNQYGRGIDP